MLEKEWCVYRHTCSDGRCYIGITSREPNERWNNGFGYQNSNYDFFRYIVAEGWNNIKHEILWSGLSESDARKLEKEEISRYGARVFNRVSAPRVFRAIPEKPEFVFESLSEIEQRAVDLVSDAMFGCVTAETRYVVWDKHYAERTIWEFESGNPERIAKEIEYQSEQKKKREARI